MNIWKRKLWHASLLASLCVNALAIGIIGHGRLLHGGPVTAETLAAKPPKSRLVEIEEMKNADPVAQAGSKESADSSSDAAFGGDDKGSGDATDGGRTESGHPNGDPKPGTRRVQSVARSHPLMGGRGRQPVPTHIAMNLKSSVKAEGKVELSVPKPREVPSMNGTIDLSKAQVNLVLHADPSKIPGHQVPNKVIGIGKVKTDVNGAKITAKCVGSIGGNTVHASNLHVILGPGVKISGTKYCAPGAGILPGSGSGSGDSKSSELPYHPKMLQALAQSGGGGKGTAGAGNGKGSSGHGQAKSGRGSFDDGSNTGIIGQAHDVIGADQDPNQVALAANYAKFAKGPVHGIDDERFHNVGMGLQTEAGPYDVHPRELHLPETHGDPGDRLRPGTSTGSSQQPGKAASMPTTRTSPFNPAPVSVGSHSERGTVPWGPDSHKKPRENGLTGAYYIGRDFEEYHFTRRDKNIDFTWTGKEIDPRLPMAQPFSVRWTGFIKPRYTETYTIYTTSDDGVRLYIDGKLLIENWNIHAATEDVTQVQFEAGKEYSIRIDYFEQTGQTIEIMKLYWESPSQPKEYVPQKCLFPSKP